MKTRKKIIPENIEKEINLKWFYLYRYLELNDLSNTLKKNLLDIISKFGDKFSFILLFIAIISIPFLDKNIIFYYILYFFWFIFWLIFIYLFALALYKWNLLIRNTFIIITSDYLIINSKILKISDFDSIEKELKKIENIFDKSIFNSQKNIYNFSELKEILKKGYENIYEKKIWSIVFILLILYAISSFFIIFMYFVAIFFIFIFSLVIGFFIKIILLKMWNDVLNINEGFIKIDIFWNKLKKSSKEIKILFKKARDNDWEKLLLVKINKNIENINNSVSKNIDLSINLKNRIKSSRYNKLYDFNLYNNWLKKELYNPIYKLKEILLIHKKNITNHLIELNKLQKDEKILNKKPFELQFIALNLQNKKVSDILFELEGYLHKLI